MNKEDILEKSRKENKDEGLNHAVNIGRGVGSAGMTVMAATLIIYNFIKGLNNDAIFSIFWTYVGLEMYGKYSFTKEKSWLVGMAAGIIAGLGFFVNYVLSTWE